MQKRTRNFIKKTDRKQRGATLIEAMVSLFVFAVGALGIAALQTTSLVRVDDSKQRSLAIWKVQELADRMRTSKTFRDPDGLLPEYLAAIGNNNTDNGIGQINADDVFDCSGGAPTRCDDVNGAGAAACTTNELVAFDIWSVMCDPNTGLAGPRDPVTDLAADGSVGLRDVELAMDQIGAEFRLYVEWQSRSANNNQVIQDEIDAREIVTTLCGDTENVDSRLNAYCVKIL